MWAGVCVIIAELMWVSRYCTQIPRKEDLRIMAYRTHNCNQLTFDQLNQTVSLAGWVDTIRDHGGVIFVDLRDEYGVTQVVFHDDALLKGVRKESVISVTGKVVKRDPETVNKKIATGELEVHVTEVTVLGECTRTLPFEISESKDTREDVRLQYRFLDLRNPQVHESILFRSKVVAFLRQKMTEMGFTEITTPILTCSSPEGARDYIIPSRKHEGKFYALPQAPQQFKQLLMTSGFDRYFQIAPCFRDEDARADRTPGEFYQLDMEMAFASQADVLSVLEDVLVPVFHKFGKYKRVSTAPFRHIPYNEAMERYGSDKPDLRIDLEIQDITAEVQGCGFTPFEGAAVKAVAVDNFTQARKWIDKLLADVEVQTGSKACWVKVDENGNLTGGVSKFLTDCKDALTAKLNLKPGSFVCMAAGKKAVAQKTAGVIRTMLGKRIPGHFDEEQYALCWIVDFPMYEIGEESGALEFCHNPFSMPQGGLKALEDAEGDMDKLLAIKADQYDLVVNGYESASGAVRNHDPEIMVKAFEMVGLGEADVKAKFPAMYNAFTYGAPPHAGAAPGVDRLIMLLTGEESIREVITFPMNKNAQDLMMGAPTTVDKSQLDTVHIAVLEEE